MFVRKNILLKKHKGSLTNKITSKKKDDKIFIVSEATNKYPVRHNIANANIGHFNHITNVASAQVYELNDDIEEGFVKHDYSNLEDLDNLDASNDPLQSDELNIPEYCRIDQNVKLIRDYPYKFKYSLFSESPDYWKKFNEVELLGGWKFYSKRESDLGLVNRSIGFVIYKGSQENGDYEEIFVASEPDNQTSIYRFFREIFVVADTPTHTMFWTYNMLQTPGGNILIEFDKNSKTYDLHSTLTHSGWRIDIDTGEYHSSNSMSALHVPLFNMTQYIPKSRIFYFGIGIKPPGVGHWNTSIMDIMYYDNVSVSGSNIGFGLMQVDLTIKQMNINHLYNKFHIMEGRSFTPRSMLKGLEGTTLQHEDDARKIWTENINGELISIISETLFDSGYWGISHKNRSVIGVYKYDFSDAINSGADYTTGNAQTNNLIQRNIKCKLIDISDFILENPSTMTIPDHRYHIISVYKDSSGYIIRLRGKSNNLLINIKINNSIFENLVRTYRAHWYLENHGYSESETIDRYFLEDEEVWAIPGVHYHIEVRNLDGLDANSKRYNVDGIGLAKIEERRSNPPLIETNKLYESLIKYDNPLLNRSFEDELFDRNLANTDYIFLPPYTVSDGIIALKGDYSLPNWYSILRMFLCGNTLDGASRSISELRVYGDASVVGTLNGQYSTNKAQTLYFKEDIVNNSGQVISKDTNLSFDISYEAYGDSKIFEIEGKVIDLSNIVNMSKCTFIQKGNVLTDINTEQMFAFDFWSVESSVAPASTLYFELDVKVYKNMTKRYDYINADYDIITLKAVNYKPSGRYFAFSISVDANELFVESYAGTHNYNVFPAIWSGNSHPTPSTLPTEANRRYLLIPRETKHSTNVFRYVTNNYSILPKTAIKNPDEYITLIKSTGFSREYEIRYITFVVLDNYSIQIKFKVKMNKGSSLKSKIAIMSPSDSFIELIELSDEKYKQISFDVTGEKVYSFKFVSKTAEMNNELISKIEYRIQDIDPDAQYINIKDD